ncbi:hypothetical protein BCR43DRAFT_486346 [Syncephalastrum racemosum]|uniref:Uncharacterized protein n=1 Tax=Syncephalastrum racemosum TaxID=13706 RepID=A0A1X2HP02_SYNRA|nr:hypothetical protein BCR43DRAFT_486346 [Syncephalastrum racemosum]
MKILTVTSFPLSYFGLYVYKVMEMDKQAQSITPEMPAPDQQKVPAEGPAEIPGPNWQNEAPSKSAIQKAVEYLNDKIGQSHLQERATVYQDLITLLSEWHDFVHGWRETGRSSESLWARLYRGVSLGGTTLAPTTTGAYIPLDRGDTGDNLSWELNRIFTGQSNITELLGLFAHALHRYLEQQPDKKPNEQHYLSATDHHARKSALLEPGSDTAQASTSSQISSVYPASSVTTGSADAGPYSNSSMENSQMSSSHALCVSKIALLLKRVLQEGKQEHVESLVKFGAIIASDPHQKTLDAVILSQTLNLIFVDEEEQRDALESLLDRLRTFPENIIDTDETLIQALRDKWEELAQEMAARFEFGAELTSPTFITDGTLHAFGAALISIVDKYKDYATPMVKDAIRVLWPYHGGLSPALADAALKLVRQLLWDDDREQLVSLSRAKWTDLTSVISNLCELLGPFTFEDLQICALDYDIHLHGMTVDFSNIIPGRVFDQIVQEDVIIFFEDIQEVSAQGDYVYKKKTGFPLFTDYGTMRATISNISIRIRAACKPIDAGRLGQEMGMGGKLARANCTAHIQNLSLEFVETRHRFVNNMYKTYLESELRNALIRHISNVLSNLLTYLPQDTV